MGHRNIMCNTEDTVNIVITLVTDDNWTYGSDYIIMYKNIKALCCTLETSILL